ncbi:MAG TPA: alpha/beta hydrolase [Acetobacteraceae bacterium]|nr:alpha/beta hydrolase [Acetobacteraceae bacterium]
MPVRHIRGVDLVYEVVGDAGPWVVVTPGGRRGKESERVLGTLIAEAGFRVLLHDRRNIGASGIALAGDNECLEQAEDMHALLQVLGIGPAYIAGCSSGARMSLLLTRHHPDAVRALLLWRVTGGPFAAKRLAWNYYEQFIEAASKGGIDAVCRTEHFAAMIQANPVNRETLQRMGTETFVAGMQRWLAGFNKDSGHPVAGITPAELRAMTVPALVIPGNDRTHPGAAGQAAHRLLPNSRYLEIMSNDVDEDVDFTGWEAKTGTLAAAFIDFLRERERA